LTELALNYTQGPLYVSYARLDMTQDANSSPVIISESGTYGAFTTTRISTITGYNGVGGKFSLDTLAATYQLGDAKLGVWTQKVGSDTASTTGLQRGTTSGGTATMVYDRIASGVSVAYTLNPSLTLRAAYSQISLGDSDSVGNTASKTTTATGLGLDYSLSKRTTAYFRYETDKDEAGLRSTSAITGSQTGNTTYTATAVGIRHAF
jgi:predicted porin